MLKHENASERDPLSASDREAIALEIKRPLDDYRSAVLRLDSLAIQRFWADSEEFVMAGDGAILGGRDAWSERLRQYERETERWNYWKYRNIHVAVLSAGAASATLEFEHSRQSKAGATLNAKGAWTYVFQKSGGAWRVIQSNGTHVPF